MLRVPTRSGPVMVFQGWERIPDEHDDRACSEYVIQRGDLAGEARPFPKTVQLARRERRYRRRVASAKQWAAIAAERQGPCLVCGTPGPSELHHVLPRSQGGDDVAVNIAPCCHRCHMLVERRDPAAVRVLLGALDDATYAYMVERGGEDVFDRVYRLRYTR